ncbi:signal recognition particle-docking protein FtsY [Salinirubrum litoreum]|uniref:Signal recognition particle receptor FtsY n=1 Tax=Salinirubrum litoreum TaxID=1126234 RepID=A0ABD5RDQ7_9EURY|nr:signal recognition particle-docking protein FtsY [Salinirubrum litoreum]
MFDGLKEKLGKFRKDAEDAAEEKPADADAEAAADSEADVEPEADATGGADDTAETATDADAETGADTEAGTGADAEPAPDEAETATAEAETADTAADSTESDERDTSDAGEEERAPLADAPGSQVLDEASERKQSSGGFAQRAKAFATGRIIIEEEDLEEPLWELEMALLESDVEMNVAEAILETIRENLIGESRKQVQSTGQLVEEALHEALYDVISVGQFDFDGRVAEADKPVVIIFTGVNGVGKTTSIAKLSRYFEHQGLSTVLANGDTYRAGANEQLRKHAENLDRKVIAHEQGGDPAAVIYDAVEYAEANDVDVVLGDTAGRLHTSNDLMEQLAKIDRVVGPDMTLFVDEAVAGQDAVQRAKTFNDAAEIDGAILTKADADSQGGAAISIAYVTGKPILFLGIGQGYEDLQRFDPEELVDSLLGVDE